MPQSIQIGRFTVTLLSDGTYRLDGGAMFGVVPKTLWQKRAPADEKNRIRLGLNCLLVQDGAHRVIIETGVGRKFDAKWQEIYAIERHPALEESLTRVGVQPEDVDLVINTHLHFDHCGGNTRWDEAGHLLPSFPRARYVVQHGEYQAALRPNERTRASYLAENLKPVEEAGLYQFIDGEAEILPGLRSLMTPGHVLHHQSILVEDGGEVLCYLGDVIPTRAHLPLPWIMGYDLYPLMTLETKSWLLPRAYAEGWILVFVHDPEVAWGRLDKAGDRYLLQPLRELESEQVLSGQAGLQKLRN